MPDEPGSLPASVTNASSDGQLNVTALRNLVTGPETVGAVRSIRTVGPATAAAGPVVVSAAVTAFAARVRTPVPAEQPLTVTYQTVELPVGAATVQPVAVPARLKSAAVRPVTSVAKVSWKATAVAGVFAPLSDVNARSAEVGVGIVTTVTSPEVSSAGLPQASAAWRVQW